MNKLLPLLTLFILLSTPAFAEPDLNTGRQALKARDYNTALANLQPLANDHNADAAYHMCGMYYLAQGVPKNDAEAARFCHIAAEKGHVEAMYNLALMYQKGEGIGQDMNEATRWYAAAAARGHKDARFNYKQIQVANTPRAQSQNLELVRKGANMNREPAATAQPRPPEEQEQIAAVAQPKNIEIAQAIPATPVRPAIAKPQSKPVEKAIKLPVKPILPPIPPTPPVPPTPPGLKVSTPPIDPNASPSESAEIAKYCMIAAQRGNPDPGCGKEFSSALPAKKAPAPKPVETAAAAKTTPATVAAIEPAAGVATQATSVLLANNQPIPQISPQPTAPPAAAKPPERPFSWFVEQANTGNAQAQNNLGVMYRRGLNGVPKNIPEAIKWFERAASQGSVNAMLNLASIYKIGEGANQNLELAYAWYDMAAGRLPNGNTKKYRAQENVQEISQYLSNEQIGDALQYVSQLEEHIPVMNEPVELEEEPKAESSEKAQN